MKDENWVGVVPAPPEQPRLEHSCARDGHIFEHIVTGDGELLNILCTACHRQWNVEEV